MGLLIVADVINIGNIFSILHIPLVLAFGVFRTIPLLFRTIPQKMFGCEKSGFYLCVGNNNNTNNMKRILITLMLAILTIGVVSAQSQSKKAVKQFNKYETFYDQCKYKGAYRMLHRSARSGYNRAQFTLGQEYQYGRYVKCDIHKAITTVLN